MVMTTSDSFTASSVRIFGCSPAMSMPTSAMASTATGLIRSAGMEPAERTSTTPLESAVRNPAAICERPALCTQTNRTLGRSVTGFSLASGFAGWGCWRSRIAVEEPSPSPERDIDQCDQNGHLDQRTNHTGERLPRCDTIRADRHGNCQLEIVSGRRESERRRLRIAEAQSAANGHPERKRDEKIDEKWDRNTHHVERPAGDGFALQREEQHDREKQAVERPRTNLRQEATFIPVAAFHLLADRTGEKARNQRYAKKDQHLS